VDVDYVMILNDGMHGYTINGKGFPATEPIVAKLGQKVRIRYMNEGMMIHPMHLHGMHMTVIDKDGWAQPAPWKCDTLNVAPGERWDVIVNCDKPGVWAFHCHVLPHAESEHGMFGMVTLIVEALSYEQAGLPETGGRLFRGPRGPPPPRPLPRFAGEGELITPCPLLPRSCESETAISPCTDRSPPPRPSPRPAAGARASPRWWRPAPPAPSARRRYTCGASSSPPPRRITPFSPATAPSSGRHLPGRDHLAASGCASRRRRARHHPPGAVHRGEQRLPLQRCHGIVSAP
jgi:hypothetical protein